MFIFVLVLRACPEQKGKKISEISFQLTRPISKASSFTHALSNSTRPQNPATLFELAIDERNQSPRRSQLAARPQSSSQLSYSQDYSNPTPTEIEFRKHPGQTRRESIWSLIYTRIQNTPIYWWFSASWSFLVKWIWIGLLFYLTICYWLVWIKCNFRIELQIFNNRLLSPRFFLQNYQEHKFWVLGIA